MSLRSMLASKSTDATVIFAAVTAPAASRSSDDRTVIPALPALFSRFAPLNCDAEIIEFTWLVNSVTSAVILPWSTFSPVAVTTFSLISLSRLVICSAPAAATATVDSPSESDSETALKPLTSDSITLEIAQMAELSLAVPIALPVDTMSCVLARFVLTDLRVCSATIALLFVRMLDIAFSFRLWRFCACSKLPPQPEVGLNSRSDICSCWGLGRLPRHPVRMQAQHGLSDANGTLNRVSDLLGI